MSAATAVTDPPGRTHRRWLAQVGILVVAWAILLGLVVGVGRLITDPLKGSVGSSDNDLARWFAGQRTSSLNDIAEYVSLLGDTRVELILAPIIAVGVWVWQRSIRPAVFVALTTAGIGGIYILSANAIQRPRPPVEILDHGLDPLHSFPSGHVGTATVLYGLIVVLVWTYARVARWWVTPLLLIPFLVMVSRMYEGAHHLSDVVTSLAFASIWLAASARVLLPRRSALPK
ncbi:MAG: phosphatase PAP2 family protein [Nocardioidaceae bacterium]